MKRLILIIVFIVAATELGGMAYDKLAASVQNDVTGFNQQVEQRRGI